MTVEVVGPHPSPPELAKVANREHRLVSEAVGSMVEHAIRAGDALQAAKAQVGHGEWLPWLSANFTGSEATAQNYMLFSANPERVRDLLAEGLAMRAIRKRLARINREEKAEAARAGGVEPVAVIGDVDTRHGDFREELADLSGVDVIATDPPYPAEFIEEFDALGELAARILKPSGLLVAMVGQSHLPDYIDRLSRHLTYRWCGAYLTDGPATRVQGRSVGTKWKPLLIYGGEQFITQDVFQSARDDKQHHRWGQSESGFADIIERLTKPGELVVDPFMGGGTTAVVCRALGRRFIGCDVDAAAVKDSRERLAA